MTLATVADRMASDANFASMLQKQPDEVIEKAGIELSQDDRMVLRSISKVPGSMTQLTKNIVLAEPWAVG